MWREMGKSILLLSPNPLMYIVLLELTKGIHYSIIAIHTTIESNI